MMGGFRQCEYGFLRVITGPMFSGKTTRLIHEALAVSSRAAFLKSCFDTRYSATDIVSHDGLLIPAVAVPCVDSARCAAGSACMIFVDEIQFLMPPHFEGDFPELVREWLTSGINVTCSGLDLDFEGVPFGVTATLLAMADEVEKCKARCAVSGEPASKTARLKNVLGRLVVGDESDYEPRANRYWRP